MNQSALLYPVFAQVALTYLMLFWMGRVRVGALQGGALKVKDIALGQDAWPPRVLQVSNSFRNQLELPILFYAVCGLALVTQQLSWPLIMLAWTFVALRLGHVLVHTTSNNVQRRFMVFILGALVLLAMWIVFAIGVVQSGR